MTRTVRALLVAIFCAYWVQVAVLILAPLKAVDLGYPAWAAAGLAALWGLIAIVLDLPAGALSDLRGRRPTIIAGGALMAAAALLLALAGDYIGLVVGIVFYSVGQSLAVGPMLAFLTEAARSSDHARVQGINGGVQGVSSVIAALAAGLLAQAGFFVAFVPLVLASLVVMVAAGLANESIPRSMQRRWRGDILTAHMRAIRMTVNRPAVGFATLGVVLFAITFTIIASTILPLVLVEFEGYAVATAGLLLAFRNLVAAGVALTFAPVTRRVGVPRAVLRMGWLAVIGTALFAIATREPLLLIIPLVLQGIGVAYAAPAANVLVTGSTRTDERGVGIAALMVASRATVLVVPLALAPFLTAAAAGSAFVVAAVLSAVVLVSMHMVARQVTTEDAGTSVSPRDDPDEGMLGAGALEASPRPRPDEA